jgi:hypothetical protein
MKYGFHDNFFSFVGPPVLHKTSFVENAKGINCLLGRREHLVWKIERKTAKSLVMAFSDCSTHYLLQNSGL